MESRLFGRVALGALFALAAAAARAQEEPPKWMVHADGGLVVVAYQVPDSDDVRFHFDCDHKSKRARVTVFEEVKGIRAGQPITIEIVHGADKLQLNGRTTTDEMSGYVYAQASRVAVAPLATMLGRDGEITVRAKSATMKLPDSGRAAAVKEFTAQCKLP